MSGTDLAVRSSGFDLTRAPDELWNEEMVALVAKSVLRGQEVTKSQLYYCLAVAEGIGLNPFIEEIYFIPAKSQDGKGPSLKPYVGRNGLVKKAADRGYYFESETIHENDRFRVSRKRDGTVEVTHSYGIEDRGEVKAAYAFLHRRDGSERPAFFLAKLEEYLPTFDADWKMAKSPWGNQLSAMIEKCALIGAGRKRLDLGNVLADGEIARVEQMAEIGPRPPAQPAGEFDFATVSEDPELVERLRVAAHAAAWAPAKLEMVTAGMDDEQLATLAGQLEAEAAASQAPRDTPGRSEARAGDTSGAPSPSAEAVTDAQVVQYTPEQQAKIDALATRLARLEDEMNEPGVGPDALAQLTEEYEQVELELRAAENPGQGTLL